MAINVPCPAPTSKESEEAGSVIRTYLIRGSPPVVESSSFEQEVRKPTMQVSISSHNTAVDLFFMIFVYQQVYGL